MIAHAQMAGQALHRLAVGLHGQAAVQAQRLGRHLVGDIRVAIPVAAHP